MEGRIIDAVDLGDELGDRSIRPSVFEEYVGQNRVKENLRIFVRGSSAT